MATDDGKTLALDVGSVRIGLALASNIARLASPAGAMQQGPDIFEQLHDFCEQENIRHIVVGLPRGLSGQETQQTAAVQAFGKQLAAIVGVPISWQDEAVTSVQAEAELRKRDKPYRKEDIDALAATYILEDYLRENV